MNATLEMDLAGEEATVALGRRLAAGLVPGMLVYLSGPLGAGKTTLARGMLRGLGYEGHVKSPTYALVELYELSRLDFYHFDFYRFSDPRELVESGLEEAFNETSVCLVEWPEKAGGLLPPADLDIALSVANSGRIASLTARTESGVRCLRQLQA